MGEWNAVCYSRLNEWPEGMLPRPHADFINFERFFVCKNTYY